MLEELKLLSKMTNENATWAIVAIVLSAFLHQNARERKLDPVVTPPTSGSGAANDPRRYRHDGRQLIRFKDGNGSDNGSVFHVERAIAAYLDAKEASY
tara:strand:+ start:1888 stop:2181 length:294 start_codon:yes stop_codon:yes gene_type:complete